MVLCVTPAEEHPWLPHLRRLSPRLLKSLSPGSKGAIGFALGPSLMPPIWVRPADGGDWVWFNNVAKATAHLNSKGINIFHTQLTPAAQKRGKQKGWQFTFKDPLVDSVPSPPSSPSALTHPTTSAGSPFFTPMLALPMCGCCNVKLLGDIRTCCLCTCKVHALCMWHGQCFKCVCRVRNAPPNDNMRPCKTCKHRVHTMCAVHVSFRVEVECKTCATPTPPTTSLEPSKKKQRRHFNPKWQADRPWLQFANGCMWCTACREHPQPGGHQSWQTGTTILVRKGRWWDWVLLFICPFARSTMNQ